MKTPPRFDPHRAMRSPAAAMRLLALMIAVFVIGTACSATAETSSVGVNATSSIESSQSTAPDSSAPNSGASYPSAQDPVAEASSAEQAPPSTIDEDPPESQQTAVEPTQSSRGLVDVFALRAHPNGSQVYIDSVTTTADATVIAGRVLNGRDFRQWIRFDKDDTTTLIDAKGRSYPLLAGASFEMEQGDIEAFEVSFAPLDDDATAIDLQLNVRADDERSTEEGFPGFALATIDLAAPAQAPVLPADLGLEDVAVHPNGASVKVQGVAFSDTHIGVGFVGTNTDNRRMTFSSGHHSSFLEDDLGHRYPLKFEGDNRQMIASANSEISGVLVFAGRIQPGASALTLVLNSEKSSSDSRTSSPRLIAGPWPLDGSFQGGDEIAPLTVDETTRHPNNAEFTVGGIEFTPAGTTVDMTVLNNYRLQIYLNAPGDGTYLVDNLGNRYLINPPSDNSTLKIASDKGIEGSFSFPGEIDPDATSLELVFNNSDLGGGLDSATAWPELTFGPWQLQRISGTAAAVIATPTNFGDRTTWQEGEVLATESSGLELIFSEFDGIEIEGGVQLTLPEGILFDSGQSRLRSDSRDSIAKIVQILEFYEGDPVTVVGHTDSEGSDAFNQGLSEDRAVEVVDALISAGGPSALLSTDGRGESDPVADNASEAGRQANRRVEIVILTTKGLPK